MPTQWAHTHYWENSSTVVTPIAPAPRGGYPVWQTSAVTLGFGFGGALSLWERLVDWLGWAWTIVSRCRRYTPQQRAIVRATFDALDHPAFPLAQAAVKKTATTLGFNRPEAWKELSRELKGSAGHAENAFRHLEACRLVRANLLTSTVTNPECHLIVELAYHGFASRVK
jgi:hypothetical protein